MNEAQMLDKTNYAVDKGDGKGYVTLGDKDTVTKITDKRVLIDIDGAVTSPKVNIAPISDLAGKKLGGAALSYNVPTIGQEDVSIKSADLIAKNKVKITFKTEIAVFDNLEVDFIKTAGTAFTTSVAISGVESQVTNGDGESEITVVLDKDIVTDATYEGTKIRIKTGNKNKAYAINNTKSVSGEKLTAGAISTEVGDKVAPEVVKYDADSDNKDVAKVVAYFAPGTVVNSAVAKDAIGTISIYFTEAIKDSTISELTFTVSGYTVTAASATGNIVTLDIKANDANTASKPNVTQAYNITDANGNVFASGTTWISR